MIYTYGNLYEAVNKVAPDLLKRKNSGQINSVYGIPRGGIPLAVAIAFKIGVPIVERPHSKTLVVDDYIDTGRTITKFLDNIKFVLAMSDYTKEEGYDHYLLNKPIIDNDMMFPWNSKSNKKSDGFRMLTIAYGEDRDLIIDKMIEYWDDLLDGYGDVDFKYEKAWNDYNKTLHTKETCVDEDYMIPFSVWVTLNYKAKKEDLDSWSFRDGIRKICHRLTTPEGLLENIYNSFNKKFKYMNIEVKVFHPVYGKMELKKEEGEI